MVSRMAGLLTLACMLLLFAACRSMSVIAILRQ